MSTKFEGFKINPIFMIPAIALVFTVLLLMPVWVLTLDSHAQWMRTCTSVALARSAGHLTREGAFAHCLEHKAWMESHDRTGWR